MSIGSLKASPPRTTPVMTTVLPPEVGTPPSASPSPESAAMEVSEGGA
jgi:hypothetical protein